MLPPLLPFIVISLAVAGVLAALYPWFREWMATKRLLAMMKRKP